MLETTAIGSTRMNLPAVPGRASSGRNANTSAAVQPRMATKIWRVPAIAAWARGRPMRRWREMFSTATMESSTSRPSATTKPAIESWFERVTQEIQDRETEGERERNRDHHDARRPPAQRQERQHHERDGDAEIGVQAIEPMLDVARLVEPQLQPDARGQRFLERRDRRPDALAHLEDVVAFLLVGGDEHRALAVEAAQIAHRLRRPVDLRHVAHAHRFAARDRDHRVAHLVQALVAARGLETEGARSEVDESRRDVGVLALHRGDHLPGREPELGHALEVERYAQLALRQRPALRGAHARHGLEQVLQGARPVLQLHVRRVRGDQRELHDVHQARADLADLQVLDLRGQRRPQRVDLARDLVVLLLRVREGLELQRREGDPVADRGLHLLDVFELGQPVLDRLGDQALEVLRVRARMDRGDEEAGDLEVGILLARHVHEGEPADDDEAQERDQRELVAADRKLEQRHGALSRDADPPRPALRHAAWSSRGRTRSARRWARRPAGTVRRRSPRAPRAPGPRPGPPSPGR